MEDLIKRIIKKVAAKLGGSDMDKIFRDKILPAVTNILTLAEKHRLPDNNIKPDIVALLNQYNLLKPENKEYVKEIFKKIAKHIATNENIYIYRDQLEDLKKSLESTTGPMGVHFVKRDEVTLP